MAASDEVDVVLNQSQTGQGQMENEKKWSNSEIHKRLIEQAPFTLFKTKWGGNAIALPPDYVSGNEISFAQICV